MKYQSWEASTEQRPLARAEQQRQALAEQLSKVQSALLHQVNASAQKQKKLQEALESAQQQYAGDLRRALLEVDEERTAAKKLQHDLDQMRHKLAEQDDLLFRQTAEHREHMIGLQQRNEELNATIGALRNQLDRSRRDLG